MTRTEQETHFHAIVGEMEKTMLKKGDDYSMADRLGVFKAVGAMVNMPAHQVVLVMMGIKIQRIINLTNGKFTPHHESVKDTSLDLACYAILHDACLNEKL